MSNRDAQREQASSLRDVLGNRNFLLLWMAQAISMTAQNAMWFALAIIVEETTHSTGHLSVAILTTILPSVVLGMAAGALVDRMNKKSVLVTTNLLRAVVVLGYLLYEQALAFVYVVNLVFFSIGQFFGPAEYATIPAVVPRRQLVAANSLFNFTFTASQLAGIVILAPAILKVFGAPALFIMEAVVYLAATLLVAFLPPGESRARPVSAVGGRRLLRQTAAEVLEGLRFCRSDRHISLAVTNLTLVAALIMVIAMLAPRFTVAVLGVRADDAVFLLAPAVIGVLVGTSTIHSLINWAGKRLVTNLGLGVLGFGLVLLGISRWLSTHVPVSVAAFLGLAERHRAVGLVPGVMVLTAIMGLASAMVVIPSQTTIMERTPAGSRGRVFAVQMLLGNLVAVLPLLFLGGLAELVSVEWVIVLLGLLVLTAGGHSVRSTREMALEPASEGGPLWEPSGDPSDR